MFETSINPWSVTKLEFPLARPAADQLRFLLNYAVLAPSGHNTQPWLFKVSDDYVEIYADKTRALPVVDPGNRELIMSCGAALFNGATLSIGPSLRYRLRRVLRCRFLNGRFINRRFVIRIFFLAGARAGVDRFFDRIEKREHAG